MSSLRKIQEQFQKTGTITLKVWVVDYDASDIEVLVDRVNETAEVTDIEFEEKNE